MSRAGRIAAVGAALLAVFASAVLWSTRGGGPSTEISVTVPTDQPSADEAQPAPVATGDVTHPVIAGPDARSLLVTLAGDPALPVACSDMGIPE